MCGICGKLEFEPGKRVPGRLLKQMADSIRHRGPDDEGFYASGPIGLGFRRLSIIDVEGGHQPLCNEDGTIWIVFNGEIYNYQSLREHLIARGHVFRTNSDTETIVHLYEEYGRECVQKLRGMFAFAVWDSKKKSLFLARDRVGIKPLYYYAGPDFLSFGSEMKAILADPAVEREVAPEMVDRFLTYLYVPGGATLIRRLFKLEPGHTLTVVDGRIEVRQYWDLDFSRATSRSSKEYAEGLVSLLQETVQLHMISDVPVGFLLSGGIDSTAMLSFAAEKTGKRLSTYTVGFSSPGIVDERPFARLAAKNYGAEHHEISISAREFADFLPGYVWHMEEPVCEPPAVALYYVSKLASRRVKVLISGEGGDEAFAGYENYRNIFWFEQIKKAIGPLAPSLGRGLSDLGRLLNSRILKKYGPWLTMNLEQYYLSRAASPSQVFNQACGFYTSDMFSEINKESSMSVARGHLARASQYGVLEKMLYVDTKTWLPDDLLIKADKMTMANSVELRVPFLDHNILEFAAGLPRDQKIRGLTMKYLVKQALAAHVPREILHRRKAGFPVPYPLWLRNNLRHWVRELLLDSRTLSRGYFRRSAIEKLTEDHERGRGLSKEIFSLVILELWHRGFADQAVETPVPEPIGVA